MGPNAGNFLFVPLAIATVVVIRMFIGSLNHARIREYIDRRGGRVRGIQWAPFGPGWFWDRAVIYKVNYRDRNGNERAAYCKTGMLIGVYMTEDKITRLKKHQPQESYSDTDVSLEEENQRLKEEIRRLKKE